jgi:hypothetical protein
MYRKTSRNLIIVISSLFALLVTIRILNKSSEMYDMRADTEELQAIMSMDPSTLTKEQVTANAKRYLELELRINKYLAEKTKKMENEMNEDIIKELSPTGGSSATNTVEEEGEKKMSGIQVSLLVLLIASIVMTLGWVFFKRMRRQQF